MVTYLTLHMLVEVDPYGLKTSLAVSHESPTAADSQASSSRADLALSCPVLSCLFLPAFALARPSICDQFDGGKLVPLKGGRINAIYTLLEASEQRAQ